MSVTWGAEAPNWGSKAVEKCGVCGRTGPTPTVQRMIGSTGREEEVSLCRPCANVLVPDVSPPVPNAGQLSLW